MTTFDGIHEAGATVRKWLILNDAGTPPHLKGRFARLAETPSPVDVAVEFVESVYANPDEFDAEAQDIAAAAAIVCEIFGFHKMEQDARGSRIARALRGEIIGRANVPAPRQDLAPPLEED